jgi:hypothetical protein
VGSRDPVSYSRFFGGIHADGILDTIMVRRKKMRIWDGRSNFNCASGMSTFTDSAVLVSNRNRIGILKRLVVKQGNYGVGHSTIKELYPITPSSEQ